MRTIRARLELDAPRLHQSRSAVPAKLAPPIAARRLYELVESVREGEKGRRGWAARAARALGVHPSYIVRVTKGGGDQQVGLDTVEQISGDLGIDPVFFTLGAARGDAREWLVGPSQVLDNGGTLLDELEARRASAPRTGDLPQVDVFIGNDSPVPDELRGRARYVIRIPDNRRGPESGGVHAVPAARTVEMAAQLSLDNWISRASAELSDADIAALHALAVALTSLTPEALERVIAYARVRLHQVEREHGATKNVAR